MGIYVFNTRLLEYLLLQDAAEENNLPATADKLDRAQSEMETLGGVLDTVLRISRIETSDDSSSFTTFSAAELVRDLAQTFEPVLEGNGQSLDWETVPSSGAPIFGDRKMVQQMLVNLIENASRHAGTGAQIELAARSDNGATTIIVADNGPGIPAEKRDEVFEPFRRLNVSRGTPGAGLGLALVKAIASRHHARVALDDNHPGLRVTIVFAPVRAPAPERRAASDSVSAAADSSVALSR